MTGRERLLAAAKHCLAEQGWGAPTVRDVAAVAGMSHAAIGYHFDGRDALMTEALIDAVADMGREVERSRARRDGAELWPLLETVHTHRWLWLAQLEAVRVAQHSPQVRAILRSGQREAQRDLGGAVAQALLVGLVVQALVDPESVAGADDVAAALRAVDIAAPDGGLD